MYLNTYLDETVINISEYALENTTYSTFYYYWRDELFGRVMRIFKDKTDPILPKEIEIRLMISGHCGIAEYKNELTAYWGRFEGISKYRDERPFYTVHSPVDARTLKRFGDKPEVVVIDNNTLRNPLFDLIHHYAILLAHVEVTTIHTAVNGRYPQGVPVAKSENQKRSLKEFFGKIFNGKYDAVTDLGELGVDYAGVHTGTAQNLPDVWDSREKILASFMRDIGIKSGLEKRSNTVEDEANADTPSMLINLNDMLESRQRGFDAVNKRFGTNWSTQLNPELEYINVFTDNNGGKADGSDS